MLKHILKLAVISFIFLIFLEILIRATRIIDFPLYEANNQIGYIPKPSQAGAFLWKNTWQFNSKSMGTMEFSPGLALDNLLVGDSVVLGGNHYRQEDRLASQLNKILKQPVWPISAGSWSLRNELIYLKNHPEVVIHSDRIIFILNNGDFGQASSWSCEETHPRTYPLFATAYIIKKYILPRAANLSSCGKIPGTLKVPSGDWRLELHTFLSNEQVRRKQITFFLYPDKSEASGQKSLTSDLEVNAGEIMKQSPSQISVYSIGRDFRWKTSFYRDDIHPTEEGTKMLAQIISSPVVAIKMPLSTVSR